MAGLFARAWARLTGRAQADSLRALDERIGKYGRAQREDLAALQAQVAKVAEEMARKAERREVSQLQGRFDDIQTSLTQQDRAYSAALERARQLDEQGVDERRFARRLEQMLRHHRPIIVGPWTGEVGFELLYWVPFVRWVVETYGIPAERLVIVSRGGVRSWYDGLAARYEDLFTYIAVEEFRRATETAKKQRQVGTFDADMVARVSEALGLERPALLHPGMMYRLFMPFWRDIATAARVDGLTRHARLRAPRDPVEDELPKEYVAARFYFSDCFPDTPANRALVTSTLEAVSRHVPVVVLSTPFAVDEHRDAPADEARLVRIDRHLSPARNLEVQSAVISRAQAFIGTYGGYSYLAPYLGVPSVALFSHRTFKAQHLHLADAVFTRLGGATLTPVDAAALPALNLTLGGLVSEARQP
jgi:hypothetical protein